MKGISENSIRPVDVEIPAPASTMILFAVRNLVTRTSCNWIFRIGFGRVSLAMLVEVLHEFCTQQFNIHCNYRATTKVGILPFPSQYQLYPSLQCWLASIPVRGSFALLHASARNYHHKVGTIGHLHVPPPPRIASHKRISRFFFSVGSCTPLAHHLGGGA